MIRNSIKFVFSVLGISAICIVFGPQPMSKHLAETTFGGLWCNSVEPVTEYACRDNMHTTKCHETTYPKQNVWCFYWSSTWIGDTGPTCANVAPSGTGSPCPAFAWKDRNDNCDPYILCTPIG